MNLKKKIAALITTAACAVGSLGLGGIRNSMDVEAAELSGKTAFEITSQMTIGWNMGNTLDATNNNLSYDAPIKSFVTAWGNPEPTQDLIDAVKAGGFNTIRIPTTWYQHLKKDDSGKWTIDQRWIDYVKNVVDMAYDNEMFVILNVHHEDFINVKEFTEETKADAAEKLTAIWTLASEIFKDYDQHLIFEGMNEPRQTGNPAVGEWNGGTDDASGYSWKYINDLNKVFVDVVRGQGSAQNKERLLMLPQYDASSTPATVRAINIPEGAGNVALSVHAYLPYFFAMSTDPTAANHEYKADGSSADGYGNNYKKNIEEFFSEMKSISHEKNAPVIIGEFNASDFHNTESRVNWAKDYMTNAKAAGIPCVIWDNDAPLAEGAEGTGENHYYISRKTNKWYTNGIPVLEKMMDVLGIKDYSLPEYVQSDFSWDNIQIGDNWVELFKSEEGKVPTNPETGDPDGWANIDIPGFENYINENYKIVLIAKSTTDPAMVLMTSEIGNTENSMGWNYIMQDGTSKQDYVYNFSYADMVATVEGSGDSMSKVTNMFASAHGAVTTVYGVYAVPLGNVEPPVPTQPEEFSWDKVSVGADWVELFRSEKGAPTVDADGEPYEWGNISISGGKDYISEAYDIVMVADSAKAPEIVLMTSQNGVTEGMGWNRIAGTSSQKYVYKYSYDDMKKVVEGTGDEMANVTDLFASAPGSVVTVYGVYAVPTGKQPVVTTTSTTETPTTVTTTTTTILTTPVTTPGGETPTVPYFPIDEVVLGDANVDGTVGISDAIALSKYLVSPVVFPLKESSDAFYSGYANADVNRDGVLDANDLSLIVEFNLGEFSRFEDNFLDFN